MLLALASPPRAATAAMLDFIIVLINKLLFGHRNLNLSYRGSYEEFFIPKFQVTSAQFNSFSVKPASKIQIKFILTSFYSKFTN